MKAVSGTVSKTTWKIQYSSPVYPTYLKSIDMLVLVVSQRVAGCSETFYLFSYKHPGYKSPDISPE